MLFPSRNVLYRHFQVKHRIRISLLNCCFLCTSAWHLLRTIAFVLLFQFFMLLLNMQQYRTYLFCNKRGHRMKVLVHDGFSIWLCARRLELGKFHWAQVHQGETIAISPEQLQALIQGLSIMEALYASGEPVKQLQKIPKPVSRKNQAKLRYLYSYPQLSLAQKNKYRFIIQSIYLHN